MSLYPNFIAAKLPNYNMVSYSYAAGSMKKLHKNLIGSDIETAGRMKGNRIIVNYSSRDIYPLLTAAAVYCDKLSAESGESAGEPSSDELWEGLNTYEEPSDSLFDDSPFEQGEIVGIDEVRKALSLDGGQTDYNGIVLLNESEIEKSELEQMAAVMSMFSHDDEVLTNTECIRSDNARAVIICTNIGEELIRLLSNCSPSATIILAVDAGRVNYSCIKRLIFELGFKEAGTLAVPTVGEYERMLTEELKENGVSVSAEAAKSNVSELVHYRSSAFSGLDIGRYVGYVLEDKVTELAPNHFAERFGVKREVHSLDELNSIIGCDKAKETLSHIAMEAALCSRLEKENGKKLVSHNNVIFTGNPGVGKTMMARIFARILGSMGVTNGSFTELGKESIVGQYLGHTEKKLAKILEQASGGVLFIDEASSLLSAGSNDIYSGSIVSMLVRFMENSPETIVIFATYPNEGKKLLELDSGLGSRIPHQVAFEDYTPEQLSKIFVSMASADGFKVCRNSESVIKPFFERAIRQNPTTLGNARAARNLYEAARKVHAANFYKDSSIPITELTAKDIRAATAVLSEQIFGAVGQVRTIGF